MSVYADTSGCCVAKPHNSQNELKYKNVLDNAKVDQNKLFILIMMFLNGLE